EILGVERDPLALSGEYRVPEIAHPVIVGAVDIDDRRVLSGLIADKPVAPRAHDIDADGKPALDQLRADRRARRHDVEADLVVQAAQRRVARRRPAAPYSELHEARTLAHADRKRAWRQF